MFRTCAFFAFVLTVVCEVELSGLSQNDGENLAKFFIGTSKEKLTKLEYTNRWDELLKNFLKCVWLNDLVFYPPESCKEDLEEALGEAANLVTILQGAWRKDNSPDGMLDKVKSYWKDEGDDGGKSDLNLAIERTEQAQKYGATYVDCASYYGSFGLEYELGPEKADETGSQTDGMKIGDLACVFVLV